MNAVNLERNNGDSLLMLFTDGPGLAEPLAMRRGGEDYYFHADGLGSVVALTDSDGAVVETYQYAAFGRPTIKDGSGNAIGSSAVGNPLMFTGTEYDPETGFYHMGYRYLDPDTGRWTQEDPIGFAGGDVNLYAYASANPATFIDPDGLSALGKVLPKLIKFLKGGRTAARADSVQDAVRLAQEGETFVMCPSKDAAKEAAREYGKGRFPIHEIDKKTGAPHYHPWDRSTHFLYGIAGMLTFSHHARGHGPYAEGAAYVADFFNPLTLPQDILDIGDAIFKE